MKHENIIKKIEFEIFRNIAKISYFVIITQATKIKKNIIT